MTQSNNSSSFNSSQSSPSTASMMTSSLYTNKAADDYSSTPPSYSSSSNVLIQNNYSTSSISSSNSIVQQPTTTITNSALLHQEPTISNSVISTSPQLSSLPSSDITVLNASSQPNTSNNGTCTTIVLNECLNDGSQCGGGDGDGLLNEKSDDAIISSEGQQQQHLLVVPHEGEVGLAPIEPTLHLSFCEMLHKHNYSIRMSMRMLMVLDLANKLVVLVNSKNLPQIKEFIRKDVKNYGIALYGHVGGGQKLIREVINYVGSKRTKRKFMPLTTACIIGCLSTVKFLMKNGANQYQKCLDELPVETAQRYGHKEIVRFLRDFSLDTCHKNRKIRKHFKHSLNEQCGLMSNCFHDVTFSFTN